LNGWIFACLVMALSVAGLVLVRRYVDIEWLKRQHDVASFFFLMVGTPYALLIAFAVFVVWTQFQDSGANLERGANEVGDLSRIAMAMPDPMGTQVRAALIDYVQAVLQEKFPAMAKGRRS
jgi:hypothetical protein